MEVRIPEDAVMNGVAAILKIAAMLPQDLPPGFLPEIADATMGTILKIESPDPPAFDKEVDLAFPLRLRPYTAFTLGGWRLTVDVFNPGNELALNYSEAGQPVLALLMGYASRDPRQKPCPLATISEFYDLLRNCAERLEAKEVCGTHSLIAVAQALGDGGVSPPQTPWAPLHPLSVIRHPGAEVERALRQFCARVEPWPRGRLLIQVMEDLDPGLWKQYQDAARLVGREPWTRYVDSR